MQINQPPNQQPFRIQNDRLPNVWQNWFTLVWRALNSRSHLFAIGNYSNLADFDILNTEAAVPFDTNDLQRGAISHETSVNNTRFVALSKGLYEFVFYPQITKLSGGSSVIATFWIKKNGVNVPNSGLLINLQTNGKTTVEPLGAVLELDENDYVELFCMSNSLGSYRLDYTAAAPPVPNVASCVAIVKGFATL